ncbi:DUF3489 domain-containing protein [Acuticoccus sp. I52.16.1]|uniref:DUF3489 domain-containing protein n=1 Tax=Acuticoccus sp. I52.16.1 TaxID=2928472 RepID=UPI001FCFAA8D|nr:DUF3489 domain-containing protein [Acuticoccus sp. I52.16.1]UOM36640.1 DUF3489 domain-containing protein [Acuticoccus sp. I52.16.1]
MTELTNTQRAVLTAAAERPGLQILPLPEHIKGGAAKKVTTALLARGLVREDGETLVATDAGLRAIGIAPTPKEPSASIAGPEEPGAPKNTTPKTRPGTKQAALIAMLEAREGATIPEIAEATGWQHHTVRGAIAGALKKRLGLDVTSEKDERRGRVYRLAR